MNDGSKGNSGISDGTPHICVENGSRRDAAGLLKRYSILYRVIPHSFSLNLTPRSHNALLSIVLSSVCAKKASNTAAVSATLT